MNGEAFLTRQTIDLSFVNKLFHTVSSGGRLNVGVIPCLLVYIRHQLRILRDSNADILRVKDSILLCLSTLLSAVKKTLCTTELLDILKDAEFVCMVSSLHRCTRDEWSLAGAIETHCRIGGWYYRHDFIIIGRYYVHHKGSWPTLQEHVFTDVHFLVRVKIDIGNRKTDVKVWM